MAFVLKDRVMETTNTSGTTNPFVLEGAKTGYQGFSAIGDGNDTYYVVTDGTNWETGKGTYTASGSTLSRTQVFSSSNSNSVVNFPSGEKDIFCAVPSGRMVFEDDGNDVTFPDNITVTSNIIVNGTVDGRDIAADGTKLDGIEASATADQTDAEIKTAYENNSNTNAFTDAEQTKLAGIAANATNTSAPFYTSAITSSDVTSALGFTPYGQDATAQFDSVELGDTAGPILSQERDQNMKLQGSSGGDVGMTMYGSDGGWDGQLYASGGTQGFLSSNWGSWAFRVDTGGNTIASGNVGAYSDIKLKDNIEVIENAIEKVQAIRGITYNRNDIEGNPRQTGVIAQEVEKVLPEAVDTKEDIKNVAYGNMVGLLIEAIKEQQAQIDELREVIENAPTK